MTILGGGYLWVVICIIRQWPDREVWNQFIFSPKCLRSQCQVWRQFLSKRLKRKVGSRSCQPRINMGGLFIFGFFFSRQVLDHLLGSWFYAFLFLWFSAFLLLCFLLSLLLCFSAFCFSCFFAFLLLFFLPLCFCTSVPFYCYYSTFSFLQSCVFAALLPAPLLLCFLSLPSLCFSFSFALFCSVCILNEP